MHRTTIRRRLTAGAMLAGVVAAGPLAMTPGAVGAPRQPALAAAATRPAAISRPDRVHSGSAAAAPSAVTKSKTVERVYVNDGHKTVVDKRTVHVTVGQTQNLRSLQQINVTWSGAHVTDGLALDPNSDLAQNEEFPFALFECRGVDSTKVPVKDRLSPDTCWTQFADERYRQSYSTTPAWTSDLYATPAQRRSVVDAPPSSSLSIVCRTLLIGVEYERWVPFVAADGHRYPGGPDGCAGLPPEGAPENLSNLSLPSNETFGVTAPNGRGRAKFDVFTGQDHASLGCSTDIPCSLVAVPIEGISCDPQGSAVPKAQRPTPDVAAEAKAKCETNGSFTPGELLNNVPQSGAEAVDGASWWAPSNWRNRITFPLTFAQSDDVCSIIGNQRSVSMFGSETMQQAMLRWAPHFCLNPKLFTPKLVQSSEPEARSQLSANELGARLSSDGVQAAVGSAPPTSAYPKPTVQAPLAVSGFGIAFDADDSKNNQVLHLNLDARLIAKLLTESYPAILPVKQSYPLVKGVATLSNNPLNITEDPEFQALNPGVGIHDSEAAAALLTLNVNSDAMLALTTYINDDPAARAWLNGQPDPWGMRVNPNYQGIHLPVERWPLLDDFQPTAWYQSHVNDCLYNNPVPYLPLVQDPQSSLYEIALDADFAISQPQTVCQLIDPNGTDAGAKLVAVGRQAPGYRFMLSTVSLPDARRFDLPLASLETRSSVSPTTKFTSAKGQTFVAPNDASMTAAAKLAVYDATKKAFTIPPSRLSKTNSAYPGTMLLNASVPTSGLDSSTAKEYAALLSFAGGPGQHPGSAAGDLPPGYVPIDSKHGLQKLAAYTRLTAQAVGAQDGRVPAPGSGLLISSPTGRSSSSTPQGSSSGNPVAGSTGTGTGGASEAGSGTGSSSNTSSGGGATPSGGHSSGHNPGDTTPSARAAALGKSPTYGPGAESWLMPVVLVVLLLGAGGVFGLRLSRRGGR